MTTLEEVPAVVLTKGVSVRCEGVVHIYRGSDGTDVVALSGVDLDIDSGERVALFGPSGAGKSTLLGLLGGLQQPSAGRVLLDGEDIARHTERELVRLRASRICTVLQGAARNLLPYATAAQNVSFVRSSLPRRARAELPDVFELLDVLGLARVAEERVGELSGGEQQRVALAVGVANAPGLLLCDEPTSQIDHDHREHVADLLEKINDEFGTTVVVVTHDDDLGHRMGRTITIRDGRVGSEGHRGEQFSVIAPDGSVPLPELFRDEWPPGTLVRVERAETDDSTPDQVIRLIRARRS